MLDFGSLTDDQVWEVGLSCGGRIQVWVDPEPYRREAWISALEAVHENSAGVFVTDLESGDQWLWNPGNDSQNALGDCAQSAFDSRMSQEVEVESRRYFLHVLAERERLIIVGAVHIAVPLVKFAKELGFETIVIDPRPALSSADRFPEAPDQIVVEWPEQALSQIEITREAYCIVLTHDPKIDDVALSVFLRSPARYIGALGSRVTQAKRREGLLSRGFSEEDLNRIHGPVGLNIGARSPEEIALSIAAEIVQVRRAEG